MILGLLQTYNGERYIRKALESLHRCCDGILCLDDGSTDATPRILADRQYVKIKIVTTLPPQKSDWTHGDDFNRNLMLRMADRYSPDFCVSLDDDEELEEPRKVRETILKERPHGMALGIAHLWDEEDQARTKYCGTNRPQTRLRAWRWKSGETVPQKALHSGSSPAREKYLARPDLRIIHWGYFRAEDRQAKFEMYNRLDPDFKLNGHHYQLMVLPVGVEPFHRKRETP